jgi:hypothetical protein
MNKNVVLFFLVVALMGCKKSKNSTTSHTVTLQPGSEGQDTYVAKIDNEPTDGGANLDWTNEIVIARWKANNNPNNATWRSYIKFVNLKDIPSNATVNSAKLYLFGEPSSLSFPNGNSSFPGSPNGDNTSLVQRVTGGDWNETTLTWNNMPAVTNVGQATISPSTSQWNYNAVVDVTDIVKEMVAHPNTNYGFCVKLANETPSRALVFNTSEAADPSVRPKLVVDATY